MRQDLQVDIPEPDARDRIEVVVSKAHSINWHTAVVSPWLSGKVSLYNSMLTKAPSGTVLLLVSSDCDLSLVAIYWSCQWI